ncbi:hypothetical protein CHS0354_039031 [Potamilus streckersoni]|uniref:Uncharacterized protein n=1 Tax=Potamilus streckersoni TaxID=2493646 RepID=A0AAE0VHQ6_9BIVA|nr:hypothetical protein CHS0354_039031 [Potamilus streckersoni]
MTELPAGPDEILEQDQPQDLTGLPDKAFSRVRLSTVTMLDLTVPIEGILVLQFEVMNTN